MRDLEISLFEAEQILSAINKLGTKKGTTRQFNYALNYNYDEMNRVLKPAYRQLHNKPERVKEYEDKIESLILAYSSISKTQLDKMGMEPHAAFIPQEHLDAFNKEAERLKKEYEIDLGKWEPKRKENIDMKEDITVEVSLYEVPSVDDNGKQLVPELEPKMEYWIGKFIDYSRELGEDVPQREGSSEMKTPEEIREEAEANAES